MTFLISCCTGKARSFPISHFNKPSSSRTFADFNISSIKEEEQIYLSNEAEGLRYHARQLNPAATSQNDSIEVNVSREQIILLPHNQHYSPQQFPASGATPKNRTFLMESQRAFQRLDTRLDIQPPLLPNEERRRIWLQRHRRRKLLLHKRREQLLSQNRFVVLSSSNFSNSTNHTCKGGMFKHKVRMAGCEPKIIINRYCHGSCASFYIPKLRAHELRASFRSCAACVPSETDLIQITLNCPGRVEREIIRTVMRVKHCACRNVEVDDYDYDSDDLAAMVGVGSDDDVND